MNIMVTGASGFVGSALIPNLVARGDRVYGLSRHPPEKARNLVPLEGDINEPGLGLRGAPSKIEAFYHLAGIHRLTDDPNGEIWTTNVIGTRWVLDFVAKHKVKHLYFVSTAVMVGDGRNVYEKSKILNEKEATEFCRANKIKLTIFKPSVILGTPEYPYPGHFSRFVETVVKLHKRGEIVRRKIEGTLRLPVLEPLFRVRGDPDGTLNLVPVDAVVNGMASIDKEGVYWLTNPNPPRLQDLADWAGEFIMVKIRLERGGFPSTPIEFAFQKRAGFFAPYLWGDSMPSDLPDCPPITKELIQDMIRRTLS